MASLLGMDLKPPHLVIALRNANNPSLSFLPFTLENVAISDIYNGLVLCWCRGADGLYRYVICNPATKKFKELPPSIHSIGEAR